jgi:hypothetical protein
MSNRAEHWPPIVGHHKHFNILQLQFVRHLNGTLTRWKLVSLDHEFGPGPVSFEVFFQSDSFAKKSAWFIA